VHLNPKHVAWASRCVFSGDMPDVRAVLQKHHATRLGMQAVAAAHALRKIWKPLIVWLADAFQVNFSAYMLNLFKTSALGNAASSFIAARWEIQLRKQLQQHMPFA
jgi:hypothetical protein